MKKTTNWKLRVDLATPFICTIIYLLLGFCGGYWHPGWIVFLAIPIVPIILGIKSVRIGWPIICIAIYLVLGLGFDLWHPGWIIFLTIPVFGILFPNAWFTIGNKKNDDGVINAEVHEK